MEQVFDQDLRRQNAGAAGQQRQGSAPGMRQRDQQLPQFRSVRAEQPLILSLSKDRSDLKS